MTLVTVGTVGTVAVQAVVAGVLAIFLGYLTAFLLRPFTSSQTLPEACKAWNKQHVMEISLFIIGVLLFFIAYLMNKIKV